MTVGFLRSSCEPPEAVILPPRGSAANGTKARGVGTVIKYGTGQYQVQYGFTVSTGVFVATIGRADTCCIPPGGEVSVAPRLSTPNAVFVQTRNSAGTPTDLGFHLVVAHRLTAPGVGPRVARGRRRRAGRRSSGHRRRTRAGRRGRAVPAGSYRSYLVRAAHPGSARKGPLPH